MITKEILQAQLDLYNQGKQRALEAFEKAKADVSAFSGAIEACEHLLGVAEELEAANPDGSPGDAGSEPKPGENKQEATQ